MWAWEFVAKPGAFQLAAPPQGTFTGAAIADYDRDGWLDIYFASIFTTRAPTSTNIPLLITRRKMAAQPHDANQRDGTFRDVTAQSARHKQHALQFQGGWNDFNNDWSDLYVVNDFGRRIFTATTAMEPLPMSHRRPEWKTWARA
jgi:hypothetical protein